jgi:FG-GAP repeat
LPGFIRVDSRWVLRSLLAVLLIATTARGQGEIRYTFVGANSGDEFGSAFCEAGDVNGDGYGDVIIGAPFDLPALGNPGSATLYSGYDGSVLFALAGTAPNQLFGFGVSRAGDVNQDGVPDVVVGMSANGSTGFGPGGGARIYSGATGLVLHTFAGTNAHDGFGQSVGGLGDLNGDGHAEVLVGTSIGVGAGIPGYARVFSGIDGSILYTKTGTFVGQKFGLAYPAGDVNGDGLGDFMIGAIGNNVNGANSGSAFVYSGATGALLHAFHGVSSGDRLGYSGHGVGDANGDGFGDVIVGTFIPSGTGYARVYSGADGSVLHHLTDGATGDAFGHTVAGVADVNGDGTPDFAVAATNSNAGGTLSGRVIVYSGLGASVLKEFVGAPSQHLGYALNPAGDVNGDHLPDIALGGLVSGTTAGFATIVSIQAAQPYGAGILPTQTLSTAWIIGAPGHESEGGLAISGAVPNASGIVAANLAPGAGTLYSVPVLVDLNFATLLMVDIVYGPLGNLDIPIDLQNAGLAGISFYAQAFELNPAAPEGVYASNGIMLLFGP